MADGPPGSGERDPPAAGAPQPAEVWRDWVTIWQSELNALATDREALAAWTRFVELWAAGARAAGALLPAHLPGPTHDGAAGRAGAEPQAGTAAPVAAPDARDVALERLASRVAALERRLAERDGGPSVPAADPAA